MPTILAIETSSELASCALLQGDKVFSRAASGVRTHSLSILPMVQELLQQAGISLKECDAIAYGSGPGSFTGVRTACGIAQGLAFGANLPVVPVMTLDAMALACQQQYGSTEIVTVLDARMGEVYWAQYRQVADAAGLSMVVDATLSKPGQVAPLTNHDMPATQLTVCGNGLSAYAEAFQDGGMAAHPEIMPHAIQIAELARRAFGAGLAVSAREAQPLYLRNKIAFTSTERAEIQSAKAAAQSASNASKSGSKSDTNSEINA